MTIIQTNPILGVLYHGGKWGKRLRHSAILSLIVFNVAVSEIQSDVVAAGQEVTATMNYIAEPLLGSSAKTAGYLAEQMDKLEASSAAWVITSFGLPSADHLRANIETTEILRSDLTGWRDVFEGLGVVLYWSSWLLWGVIAYSTLWMILDVRIGKARWASLGLLAMSLMANLFTWSVLYSDNGPSKILASLL